MKNFFLYFFLFSIPFLKSQPKHLIFEAGNLASVTEKAKKENKLIFIDAYTSWCGPCKDMAKNVFTNDSVAHFFNTKFVNYKLDVEKGEGVDFATKYNVGCYPGFLFIDVNGTVVHRGSGYMNAKDLLIFARNSLIPEMTFSFKKEKLEENGLKEDNVLSYISLMGTACQDASPKVNDYIKTLREKELQKRINWILLRDYVVNWRSKEITYFLNNIKNFEKKFGRDTVEEKVIELGKNYFVNYVYTEKMNKTAFEKAKKEFLNLNWPYANKVLFQTNLNFNRRFNKKEYFALAASEYLNYYSSSENDLNSMAWSFYENVTDENLLNAAISMSRRACEIKYSYPNLDTYAALLYKAGNYSEAEKQVTAAIETARNEKMKEEEFKDTMELYKKIKAKLHSK